MSEGSTHVIWVFGLLQAFLSLTVKYILVNRRSLDFVMKIEVNAQRGKRIWVQMLEV
ncbi:hypothetical protein SDC9_140656 [bioreactor metagenome]|uniref:Uncharacterized protein n=1 Tax=bioreactor metagenome TaxID=1076179 RepID=A0A645DWL1_9ZZZZ